MDKAKILRLCNEIEKEISEAWNCDVIEYDKAGHIISIAQAIADEIIAPPKSNGDKIREMTDEELAEWLAEHGNCRVCAWYKRECVKHVTCKRGVAEWLRKEAEDAGSKTD